TNVSAVGPKRTFPAALLDHRPTRFQGSSQILVSKIAIMGVTVYTFVIGAGRYSPNTQCCKALSAAGHDLPSMKGNRYVNRIQTSGMYNCRCCRIVGSVADFKRARPNGR